MLTVSLTTVVTAPTATGVALAGGGRVVTVVDVAWYRGAGADSSPTSVTDTLGNTYLPIGATESFPSQTTTYKVRRYALIGGVAGTGDLTAAFTNANDLVTMFIRQGLSSVGTTIAQDQAPAALAETHSDATPYVSNSATTVFADELLLATVFTASNSGTEAFTQNNSFVTDSEQDNTSIITGCSSHRVVSATGTFTASVTSSGAGTTEAITLLTTFNEIAAGAPTNALFFGAFP